MSKSLTDQELQNLTILCPSWLIQGIIEHEVPSRHVGKTENDKPDPSSRHDKKLLNVQTHPLTDCVSEH